MSKYIEYRKINRKKEYHKEQVSETVSRKKRISSIKKLVSMNKLSKALAETERYLEDYPDDGFGMFQHANILILLNEIEDAKKEFQYIIDNDLESKYSSIYKLGIIAIQQEEPDKAYEYFKTNVENSPYDEIFSIVELSKLELEKGNIEEAYNILNRCSNIYDEYILLQKAVVLRTQGKYKEAYDIIANIKCSKYKDLGFEYNIERGLTEIKLEKYEEAEKSLRNAMVVEKTNVYYKAETELAYMYYRNGDLNSAIDACFDILEKTSTNNKYRGRVLIVLGNICKGLKKYDEAHKYFSKSLDCKTYDGQKGYICLAGLHMIKREYDEAKLDIENYLKDAKTKKAKSIGYLKLALINSKENDLNALKENLKKIDKNGLDKIDLEDYRCLEDHIKRAEGISLDNIYYTNSQHENYSLDALVKHIDKVHTTENISSVFDKNINLEELVLEIPELLTKAYMVSNHYYEYYDVEYQNIGYVNGKSTNTLRMIVFPECQKVLTMFPVDDLQQIPKLERVEKQKSKSQIDKFNQRYGKKS